MLQSIRLALWSPASFLELVHTNVPFCTQPQLGCGLPLEGEAGSLRYSFRE